MGKSGVERRVKHVKEDDLEVRPVKKPKLPNLRFVSEALISSRFDKRCLSDLRIMFCYEIFVFCFKGNSLKTKMILHK
jgi:hypothetical protein